jgi:dolichyl-phosphate beta-glucosyltransferase
VLVSDLDLSTPLSEVEKLLRALEAGADLAIGSRAVEPSLVRRSAYRDLMGHGYNALVRLLTRLPNRDTQCGFKLLPAKLARSLLANLVAERYSFDVELLLRARALDLSVAEVPVRWTQADDSRIGLRAAPQLAWDTLRVGLAARRGELRSGAPGLSPRPSPSSSD